MTPHLKIAGIIISKKHLPVIPRIASTLALYGASVVIAVSYFADVTLVMKHVPFYKNNLRFPYEDDKRVYTEPRIDI